MAVEPGSAARSFRLQPSTHEMSDDDKQRLGELAQQLYASNSMFRVGVGTRRANPLGFRVLLHPSMKGAGLHPSRARVLSRMTNAIMHVRVDITETGELAVSGTQMTAEMAAHDAGFTLALVTFIMRELERLQLKPELPVLSKIHVVLKVILDQATTMYCSRAGVEKPA